MTAPIRDRGSVGGARSRAEALHGIYPFAGEMLTLYGHASRGPGRAYARRFDPPRRAHRVHDQHIFPGIVDVTARRRPRTSRRRRGSVTVRGRAAGVEGVARRRRPICD